MTGPDANTQDTRPVVTTYPLLGVAGVLLGALIATCTGRVGLVDIRGALHLGVDEGSWINIAFNDSTMFIRTFSKYLGGPRRLLLPCTWIFTVASFLIPFCHSLEAAIALLVIASLRQMITSASAARRELRAAVRLCLPLAFLGSTIVATSAAQQSSANPMQLTLDQAINLALKQNHSVHLRSLSVEQMQSKKDEARSNFLPQIKTSGSVLHVTELEGVAIPVGAFGSYPSTGPVPSKPLSIDQGSATSHWRRQT